MLVVIGEEIFNMNRFDSIKPASKDNHAPDRIAFCRGYKECDYAAFNSEVVRDVEWKRIKDCVNEWYTE